MAVVPGVYVVGIVAAFVSGYLSIKFLLRYLSRHGLGVHVMVKRSRALGLFALFSVFAATCPFLNAGAENAPGIVDGTLLFRAELVTVKT